MEQEKTPNWMKHPPLLQFYRQVQAAGVELEPDPDFLEDQNLGRYGEYQLKDFEIPQNIRDFLLQVGLPDQFINWRSPNEERDSRRMDVTQGEIFWVSCLKIKSLKRKKYLIIGEMRNLARTYSVSNYSEPDRIEKWNKTESSYYIMVELKTGTVWKWIPEDNEFTIDFVNSSLEQYLLSMAYWRTFYPEFSERVKGYTEKNPKETEISYIFDNDEVLYAPFLNILKTLDPKALEDTMSYWNFMCDLSLY